VTGVQNTARAVRILTGTAAGATLALALVFQSTVPDWCAAPQATADAQCATSAGSVK
jgi:hypothetical protein